MDLTGLICELNAASHGSKRDIIMRYALIHNTGLSSIYRALSGVRGKTRNVKRESKIEDTLIDEVAKLKMKGMINGVSFRELSTELCIDILKDQGITNCDKLKVSTVNRRLAEKGFRVKDPIVRVEAQYANQQHQMDFSRSKYFQLYKFDNDADDFILKATTRTLSYKENENKLRLWLSAITDAYSRVSLARAFPASGESELMAVEFMYFAFNREEDEHHFRYIPETLKTDNGIIAKSKPVKELLDKLEVKRELVLPYKKRGIQKVESNWRLIWQRFELRNYIVLGEGKTITLKDYNDLLHQFMIDCMSMQHPMKKETREHVYLTSLVANPPRKLEGDIREIFARPEISTIRDDCTISIDTQKYQVSNPRYIGMKIRTWKNLRGEIIGELVDEYTKPFALTATEGFVELGDYEHRHHQTYRQELETQLNESLHTAAIEAPKSVADTTTDFVKKIHYLAPDVKRVEVETKFDQVYEQKDYSFPNEFKARLYIAERLGRQVSYSTYASVFDPLLKQTLKRSEIDALIETVREQKMVDG